MLHLVGKPARNWHACVACLNNPCSAPTLNTTLHPAVRLPPHVLTEESRTSFGQPTELIPCANHVPNIFLEIQQFITCCCCPSPAIFCWCLSTCNSQSQHQRLCTLPCCTGPALCVSVLLLYSSRVWVQGYQDWGCSTALALAGLHHGLPYCRVSPTGQPHSWHAY